MPFDPNILTDGLNDPQQQAVTAKRGHQLILAGAGSGKTRVLVHRIAWLIAQCGLSPYGLLALTFTNKAAKEMRHRLEQLLDQPLPGMWLGTFHGICHRFLRQHADIAGLDPQFQIIDGKDQLQLVKRLQKACGLNDQKWPAQKTLYILQQYKAQGLRHKDVEPPNYAYEQKCLEIYGLYEDHCQRTHAVDFTELMLRTLEILKAHPELQQHYHERFSDILIDEFQDTNTMQYQLLQLFAGPNASVMAVGDDDQSIYSWRGACVDHMHHFVRDFKHCKTIKLEQNYRSTQTILSAANAVIQHNEGRLGKDLWTDQGQGEPLQVFTAYNDMDEARHVITQIATLHQENHRLDDIAILYRSNAQSRVLEDQLTHAQIPYRIYGGLRFFDRAEIKDVLYYARLIVSRSDDAAFERVVNKPARGIGQTTLTQLRDTAQMHRCPLWYAIEKGQWSGRAQKALHGFVETLETLAQGCQGLALHEQINLIVQNSGLLELYQQDDPNNYQNRVENLQELVNAANVFAVETQQDMVSFLASISLDAGDEVDDNTDKVQLMTVHAAKGLEFQSVFLTGLEEGLFPHQMSLRDEGLEEERRLCYVAMTRARERLYLSHAQSRRLNGQTTSQYRSRFIGEIPHDLIAGQDSAAPFKHAYARPQHASQQNAQSLLRLGQWVRHTHFGTGTVINCEGTGDQTRVQIQFEEAGTKWLMLSHAPLEILS